MSSVVAGPRIVGGLEIPEDFAWLEPEEPRIFSGEAFEVKTSRKPLETLFLDAREIPLRNAGLVGDATELNSLVFPQGAQ